MKKALILLLLVLCRMLHAQSSVDHYEREQRDLNRANDQIRLDYEASLQLNQQQAQRNEDARRQNAINYDQWVRDNYLAQQIEEIRQEKDAALYDYRAVTPDEIRTLETQWNNAHPFTLSTEMPKFSTYTVRIPKQQIQQSVANYHDYKEEARLAALATEQQIQKEARRMTNLVAMPGDSRAMLLKKQVALRTQEKEFKRLQEAKLMQRAGMVPKITDSPEVEANKRRYLALRQQQIAQMPIAAAQIAKSDENTSAFRTLSDGRVIAIIGGKSMEFKSEAEARQFIAGGVAQK